MPAFIETALRESGMTVAYEARPPYQRNDYIWWISSPKREATKQKRLGQMLDELARGDRYMNMAWHPAANRGLG